MSDAIQLLAEHLTDSVRVCSSSINLGMPEGSPRQRDAAAFFALRTAFGVSGYATAEEARKAIALRIGALFAESLGATK